MLEHAELSTASNELVRERQLDGVGAEVHLDLRVALEEAARPVRRAPAR